MSTKRTTITINRDLYERAAIIMRARAIGDFSNLVQTLIREDYERRESTPSFRAVAEAIISSETDAAIAGAAEAVLGRRAKRKREG